MPEESMGRTYISKALRRQVAERARHCCEYCLIPEAFSFAHHQIDHILAKKHAGRTKPENLAFSCALCNKHKGSDITSVDPQSHQIVSLFHPRKDFWPDHFKLVGGEIQGLTATGRATVHLLQLNRRERILERKLLKTAGAIVVPKR